VRDIMMSPLYHNRRRSLPCIWRIDTRRILPGRVGNWIKFVAALIGLGLQINSQHTGSAAESYFADLVFRNIAQ
jgi:hypothetical protein